MVVISPAHREVAIGMTTTVDIRIQGVTNLYGAEVHLTFNPSIVHVVDADPSSPGTIEIALGTFPYPDYVATNSADNTAGTIDVALTQTSHPPRNGSGVLGTITFQALVGGVSPVHFVSAILVNPDGIEILSGTQDGEVVVLQYGTLVGQVTFQGREPADWSCPLSVALFVPGQTTPRHSFSPVCDRTGTFTVTNIVSGTYHIKVRDQHSLWNVRQNFRVVMGTNHVNLGTILDGDSDLNGVINVQDFGILSASYGTAWPNPGFDPRADYNNSDRIDIYDFSLLATNFGRSGENIVTLY
jgi:hypothetical protein